MAELLRALAAIAENQDSVLSTRVGQHTTV